MKYRIVKKYYDNTLEPFYVVEEKKWFFWGVPASNYLRKLVIFASVGYECKKFKSIEAAEEAVKKAKVTSNKNEVVKYL